MKNIKDILLIVLSVVIIILMLFGWVKYNQIQKKLYDEINNGNKVILSMDKTTKESDGQYAKLVNYFNTEKDLNNQLKEQNGDLFKLIKKQDERLLMINNTIVTLEGKVTEGFGSVNKNDTNRIDLKLNYPDEKNSFITWNGFVNRKTAFYKGEFTFGKLPLQIVMTETDRGIWKSRLIGPEWLIVDSMDINSLPLPTPEKQSKWGLLLGGGFQGSFNQDIPNAVSLAFAVQYKKHMLMLDGNTNRQVGLKYLYRLENFKNK
jgi:hypothetical protein